MDSGITLKERSIAGVHYGGDWQPAQRYPDSRLLPHRAPQALRMTWRLPHQILLTLLRYFAIVPRDRC
jgi:hypothetical protein